MRLRILFLISVLVVCLMCVSCQSNNGSGNSNNDGNDEETEVLPPGEDETLKTDDDTDESENIKDSDSSKDSDLSDNSNETTENSKEEADDTEDPEDTEDTEDAEDIEDAEDTETDDNNTVQDEDENATVSYTVNFLIEYNGDSFTQTTDSKLTQPKLEERTGYRFLGWFYENSLWDFNSPVTSNITLTAKWELINYDITYVLDGGVNNPENPTRHNIENPITGLYDPNKDDAYFFGWYLDENFTKEFSFSDNFENITVYAKFISETEGLVYELIDNGYYVTSYTGTDDFVIIPRSHNSACVVGIADSAFANSSVREIMIADSVKYVGKNAFVSCSVLKYSLHNGIKYLGNSENPYRILIGGKNKELETCEIHEKTEVIADGAFCEFQYLSKLTGGEDVKYIGSLAFSYCSNLKEFPFFDTVEEIGYSAFSYCGKLEIIKLNELKSLGERAFSYCVKLKFVDLSSDITVIPQGAFQNCVSIDKLVLGDCLEKICEYAFDQVTENVSVFTKMSKTYWKAVNFSNNYIFDYCDIYYYSSAEIIDEENYWYLDSDEIKIWNT